MIKRIFFIIFLIFFLFLISDRKIFACTWVDTPMSDCESHIGSPANTCCHNTGGCSGTPCGTIPWYGWCHATGCRACVEYDQTSCSFYWWSPPIYPSNMGDCVTQIAWHYTWSECSAVDTCSGGPHLRCGLCESGGCAKCSGYYKQCCDNMTVHSPST